MEPSHQLRVGVRGGCQGGGNSSPREHSAPRPFSGPFAFFPWPGAPRSSKQRAPNANNRSSGHAAHSALCIRSNTPPPNCPARWYQCFDRGQHAENRKGPPSCFSPWLTPAMGSGHSPGSCPGPRHGQVTVRLPQRPVCARHSPDLAACVRVRPR